MRQLGLRGGAGRRDLHHERARRALDAQGVTDEPHELRVVEDARRDVHAHAEVEAVAVPHRGREERFAYDPRLDVADETFALRGRDEIERRDEATLGVVPA